MRSQAYMRSPTTWVESLEIIVGAAALALTFTGPCTMLGFFGIIPLLAGASSITAARTDQLLPKRD